MVKKQLFWIFYVLILSDENTSDEFNNVFLDHESVHLKS